MNHFKLTTVCVAFSCFAIGCNNNADKAETANKATETPVPGAAKPDMVAIKAEIQTLENAWAAADNARDANTLASFYSDDAVSMGNNRPMAVGKAAILKDLEASLAKRGKGATVAYDVLDVFGDENTVTEVGKTTVKDASGRVMSTGKYMAVWQKRNGKYICVRDIGNDDVKEK